MPPAGESRRRPRRTPADLDPELRALLRRERVALVRGHALVVANLDGSERRLYRGLRSVLQYGLHPTWAHDGASIVVHSGEASGQLLRVTLATGQISPVAPAVAGESHWYPEAAPGGLAFMREANGRYSIGRIAPDGTLAVPLVTTPAYEAYYRPAVSPDGAHLAVSVFEEETIGVRVFALPDGTATSRFIANATSPRWSPDGAWVACSMRRAGPLRVMRPDMSGLRVIGTTPFGEWFDWTSDGAWLVGNTAGGLAMVRIADGWLLPLEWALGMWQPAIRRARAPG